jgi:uncharacterized membrane protein
MDIVKTRQPSTVKELVRFVQDEFFIPEEEITRCIIDLSNKGKIKFIDYPLPKTFKGYIFSVKATWYWVVLASVIATTMIVFTIPEDIYPAVYIRYTFGFIFVLFFPGYSFIKVLFPAEELYNIEKVALSIGMSLVLVAINGLLLNYTPWGIRTTSVTLSLLAITIIFATAAIIREQQARKKADITSSHK